ncbi:lipoprotein LppV [Mycobacteroides abscessus subsp. massiliense]|uniref:LppA family lipoprotein n=1 Tax=Mycobacteroides abscessus TaxID=36809 RepID=UPI0009A73EDC|nr:LppA family lipoprotein [Mycobacteroides abscessus]SLG77889.1 lipoprotein LppV [Mycobacteroides abscessus subsp. massiliense]SLI17157.1 lipoprotein LppV [Mycobacteroides abscessus subsp. massiliense]
METPYKPTDPTDATKAAVNLAALPSLEETHTQLTSLIEEIGAQATAIAPELTWKWNREPSRGGCNPPYEQSQGELILMPNYISSTPIPEEHWRQIFEIAKKAAASLGATSVETFQDSPNNHDVRLYNETGTAVRIGSQKAALISGSTGCRLPAAKK